ncbi:MAG: hypothetical protein OM95_14185 [Bdellovibrio sp. ArHS]|uniref:hypothetical protein n=1 Tax=Bdellovibrio sp. ArHS TaxID=1569284 RepID=UPI0005828D3C|nr:hypothetical protein [Bdellovibrio sp. ArHS]KHD87512.1 MAG: hypothetical protein OM95_14185 [Bdellovibrio sp. ArHS]
MNYLALVLLFSSLSLMMIYSSFQAALVLSFTKALVILIYFMDLRKAKEWILPSSLVLALFFTSIYFLKGT